MQKPLLQKLISQFKVMLGSLRKKRNPEKKGPIGTLDKKLLENKTGVSGICQKK